jgi:hypothetical protein
MLHSLGFQQIYGNPSQTLTTYHIRSDGTKYAEYVCRLTSPSPRSISVEHRSLRVRALDPSILPNQPPPHEPRASRTHQRHTGTHGQRKYEPRLRRLWPDVLFDVSHFIQNKRPIC